MPGGRRSMGTKKVDVAAIRAAQPNPIGNENREPLIPATSSSGLRTQASTSRLPRPQVKPNVGAKGRSSSIEKGRHRSTEGRHSNMNQQNVGFNAFRTPRSTSRGWTPNGNKSSGRRKPLNSLQNPNPPRYFLELYSASL